MAGINSVAAAIVAACGDHTPHGGGRITSRVDIDVTDEEYLAAWRIAVVRIDHQVRVGAAHIRERQKHGNPYPFPTEGHRGAGD